jgi:hypothetical protein
VGSGEWGVGSGGGNSGIQEERSGKLLDVNSVIHQLHVLSFAEVIAWTPPVPSLVKGEVIRVLTRQVNIGG